MRSPTTQFPLVLFPTAGEPLSAAEATALAEALRAELLTVDGVQVEQPAPAPPDARFVAEAGAVLELVITAGQTVEVLAKVVQAVARWRRRHADRVAVEVSGIQVTEHTSTFDRIVERLAGGPAVATSGPVGARRALVIANLLYADPALRGLRAPADDARALERVLGNPRIGGFTVETCVDATDAVLRRRIADFFADSDPDDLLLVHYSGHGMKDGRGRLYLTASDTEVRRLAATGVPAGFLNDQMSDSPSRRIVLILDCCYSGAFSRGSLARADRTVHVGEELGGEGRVVLTASSATEYAFEGDELSESHGQPSVFTSALVRGLESGEADTDGDGEISIDELYDFVYREVRRTQPGQVPHKWTFGIEGSLVIAHSVRPVQLPDSILDDLASERVSLRLDAVDDLARVQRRGTAALRDLAVAELVRLRDHDDSARVRVAAAQALGETAPPPAPGPEPVVVAAPEPVVVAEPEPEVVVAQAPAPQPLPEPTPEPKPERVVPVGRRDPVVQREPVVVLPRPDEPTLPTPPRKPKRALAAAGAGLALILVVVGTVVTISKLTGKKADNSSSHSGSTNASGFNLALTSVVNPSTKKGGTLKLGTSAVFDSYDPAGMYFSWEFVFSRYYLRTLVAPAPKPGKVELVGDLAKDWTISADRKTYSFHLRPGISFEDGTPITSRDIKYGVERTFDPAFRDSGYPLWMSLDSGRTYQGPATDKDPAKLGLKVVKTPDDATIMFQLEEPDPNFIYMLSTPGSAPVPRAKDTGTKTYGDHPVASGPYKIATLVKDKEVRLVRNDKWDGGTDPTRTALPDEISLTLAVDKATLDKGLLSGDFDLDAGSAGLDSTARTQAFQTARGQIDQLYDNSAAYLALDVQVAPFDSLACRKAVAYAIDRVAILNSDPSLSDSQIATAMMPPGIPGFDKSVDPFGTGDGIQHADEAKQALKECGHPNGFSTKLAYRDLPSRLPVAHAIQTALGFLGISAELKPVKPADYYNLVGDPAWAKKEGVGIMLVGWIPDLPTGPSMLGFNVGAATSLNNYARLSDTAIDKLVERAATEEPAQADVTWREIDAAVVKTAAYIPLYYHRYASYRSPRLTNVYAGGFYGMIDLMSLGVVSG